MPFQITKNHFNIASPMSVRKSLTRPHTLTLNTFETELTSHGTIN